MAKLTSQQLKEIYMKLPKDLQDAIFSIDSSEAIQSVGKKHNLTVEKIGDLADEISSVMLGLTKANEFIPSLFLRLNTDKETARKIAEDINEQVFSKVRESLKKVHHEEEEPAPAILNVDEKTFNIKTMPDIKIKEGAGGKEDIKKEDIMKEIEIEEDNIPKIFQGLHIPAESPFEAKTKDEIFRMPPEESIHEEENKEQEKKVENKYPSGDPYREPVE